MLAKADIIIVGLQTIMLGRMLKKCPNNVLGSLKSSTYSRGYASGFDLPPALLDQLFEHPVCRIFLHSPLNIRKLVRVGAA